MLIREASIENPTPTAGMAAKTNSEQHPLRPELSAELSPDALETLTQSFRSSTLEKKDCITIVDTDSSIVELLESLTDLPAEPPSLYVDLEGVNLSRYGTISILQIFVFPTDRTFLVDIHTLRDKAFSHSTSNGTTLRSILESPSIPKVFFDVRHDSDALYSHYRIELSGVQDLQLMELAKRQSPREFVNGLAKCIEHDAPMTASQKASFQVCKENGKQLFAPEHGGSYDVFNIRPLPDTIVQYCVQDVQFLPKLWQKYNEGMSPHWKIKIEQEVKNRVALSQSPFFNGKGRQMTRGPRGWS